MKRSLVLLIDEMLKEIPSNEKSLIAYFKDIQSSQRVRASEDMTGWILVSEELQSFNLNSKSPLWQIKLCSLFSMVSVDEIIKSFKENKDGKV